jgi:hypothetical protein
MADEKGTPSESLFGGVFLNIFFERKSVVSRSRTPEKLPFQLAENHHPWLRSANPAEYVYFGPSNNAPSSLKTNEFPYDLLA